MHAHRYAPSAATITFIAPTGSDSWRNICCACWAYVHIAARPVTSAFSGGVEGREQACALLRIVLRAKDPASSKTRFLKKRTRAWRYTETIRRNGSRAVQMLREHFYP